MSYRSRRTRAKGKDNVLATQLDTDNSVQDIVSQVINDVANGEVQGAENLTNLNLSKEQQPTTTTTTLPSQVNRSETDDFVSNQMIATSKPAIISSSSQQNAPDAALRLRASLRRSVLAQNGSDHPINGIADEGGQGVEEQMTSFNEWARDWTQEPVMTDQVPSTAIDEYVPSYVGNFTETQLPVVQTSGALDADSSGQFRHSKKRLRGVEEDVEDLAIVGNAEDGDGNSKSAIWTDDIKFDDMEEVEMRDLDGKRGRKGGKIQPRHVWDLKPGVRFVVPFNSLDQPIRKGGYVLLKFLGDVAKKGDLCPIGEVNWRRVDKKCKAEIICLVRDKFVLPAREEIDKDILKHVGNKWRGYKYELKVQHKKPGKTLEEVASVVPKGLIPSQWVKLVQYWFSDKAQFLSAKGKEARAAHLHHHTTGAKSFARMRDEFEKASGRKPGALEWFAQTHQKKDGTFVDNSSKEFLDAASALVAQRAKASSSSQREDIENEVFNELMYSDEERYHRPIGYGFGVNKNKVFGIAAELRKRGHFAADTLFLNTTSEDQNEDRRSGYISSNALADVQRLKFTVAALSETNELMQSQLEMQSQKLKMQSQQLQMQSRQMEGFRSQLQQVTSLMTKFGVMLNKSPRNTPPTQVTRRNLSLLNTQVPRRSFGESDCDSESEEWDSD